MLKITAGYHPVSHPALAQTSPTEAREHHKAADKSQLDATAALALVALSQGVTRPSAVPSAAAARPQTAEPTPKRQSVEQEDVSELQLPRKIQFYMGSTGPWDQSELQCLDCDSLDDTTYHTNVLYEDTVPEYGDPLPLGIKNLGSKVVIVITAKKGLPSSRSAHARGLVNMVRVCKNTFEALQGALNVQPQTLNFPTCKKEYNYYLIAEATTIAGLGNRTNHLIWRNLGNCLTLDKNASARLNVISIPSNPDRNASLDIVIRSSTANVGYNIILDNPST